MRSSPGFKRLEQGFPTVILRGIESHIGETLEKGFDLGGRALDFGDIFLDRRLGEGLDIRSSLMVRRDTPMMRAPSGIWPCLVAMVEGRQQLALGQIAGRAEDDEIENLDGNDTRGHFLCSAIKEAAVLDSAVAQTTGKRRTFPKRLLIACHLTDSHHVDCFISTRRRQALDEMALSLFDPTHVRPADHADFAKPHKGIGTDMRMSSCRRSRAPARRRASPWRSLTKPWLEGRKIVMLEPRRLAARAAAARMAQTLDEAVGETVGYAVRLERKISAATRIEVVTEGILTRQLQADPALLDVGLLIFDEFHERSLDGDLGLALALDVQAGLREDLKILVMSATLDEARLSHHLGAAPVISAPGRVFPVETRYGERPERTRCRATWRARSCDRARRGEGRHSRLSPGRSRNPPDRRRLARGLPAR